MLRKHICLLTILMAFFCLCSSGWAGSVDISSILDKAADNNWKPATQMIQDPQDQDLTVISGNWRLGNPLQTARYAHDAVALDSNRLLVCGGSSSVELNSCQIYDVITGTWAITGNMVYARSWTSLTRLNDGRVLATGGSHGIDTTSEIYDPTTGSWHLTGTMVYAVQGGNGSILLPSGKVLVAGGRAYPWCDSLTYTQIYDPTTGTWSSAGNMNTKRQYTDRNLILLGNGKVLIAGGLVITGCGPNGSTNKAELFDPSTGQWSYTGDMTTARAIHRLVQLQDGRVLACGGDVPMLSSCEIYSPTTGQWTATGSMNVPRSWHTQTLLSDGKILIAGGNDSVGITISSTEIYDPTTGQCTLTASMNQARMRHSADRLSTGQVIVVGGYYEQTSSALSSVEIYDSGSGASISGTVKVGSTAVPDVTITFSNSGGTATTDSSGNYSITVPSGYTGTATPSKTGYTFSPATRTYSNLTTNQTGQDYTATLPPVVVSGSVKTASATGVSGVLITFSNSGGTATTDASGNYSITVPNGYAGMATPAKTGYTFSPATRTYSNLTTNQTGQDYTATPQPVLISGGVKTASGTGISGVTITFSSSGGTATTDGSGNYSITVPNGYTGTATPSKTGYTFSPATRTYSNLTANQTGQDYTATLPTVVVSGSVKTASGAGVSGVLITFSNSGGTATTDSSGNYSITVPSGYTGTATPSKTGYTFSPASKSYSGLTTNQAGQDYIGTPIAPTISGSVKTLSGTAISGVMITFSNGGGPATTDSSGNYSVTVPNNYSGMATPSKTGYTFDPASKSYSNVTTPKTGENYVGTPIPNPKVGSNSIDAIDVIKITDMSGLLPDSGGAVTVMAWDKDGKQLTTAGSASPLSILNHGTTSILGEDLKDRFPDGAPAAYSFSVESSKMFITNVNNSIDVAVKVPIIYSNGLSNFVSNSIGSRNTLKLTDMSGTIGSAGIAITVTAWDASGKAIPESISATPLKLGSHGTTTIAGSSLAARFLPGVPMTYEFTIASPKLVISNVKNSSDGTLNIPTVYTVGVNSFVSNSIGSRNTIYISDFSGALDIGGAAIKVRAWDVSGTEIAESDSLSSYKIFNYETVKITGAELASRFSAGSPMTYEFTVDSSNVVITNVKSSSDASINIPTVYTSGITKYTTNYVGDLNTIRITDMSGGITSGGGSITIIARDGIGTLIPESGSATALKLINHGTTTIEGIDLRNRFPGGTPVTYEFSIGSSSAVVTNLTESTDGTINIPAVFTLGPYGGI